MRVLHKLSNNEAATLTAVNVRVHYTKGLSPIIRVGEYALTTSRNTDEREIRLLSDSINKFTFLAQQR